MQLGVASLMVGNIDYIPASYDIKTCIDVYQQTASADGPVVFPGVILGLGRRRGQL